MLVAALTMAADWVENAPSLLPPFWLATGVATALAMRWPIDWMAMRARISSMVARAMTRSSAMPARRTANFHRKDGGEVFSGQCSVFSYTMRQCFMNPET